jgi:PleD family two-component response regulator
LNPHDLIFKALKEKSIRKIQFTEKVIKKESKPMILVVDDSITTRTLQKNILENNNFSVTVAVNGKEAWEKLQRVNYAIIITDVNMPVMDGYELTEKIKSHDKYKHIPVVMVTSRDSEEEKKKGLDVGANAYIVKSEFESGALLEVISQWV